MEYVYQRQQRAADTTAAVGGVPHTVTSRQKLARTRSIPDSSVQLGNAGSEYALLQEVSK